MPLSCPFCGACGAQVLAVLCCVAFTLCPQPATPPLLPLCPPPPWCTSPPVNLSSGEARFIQAPSSSSSFLEEARSLKSPNGWSSTELCTLNSVPGFHRSGEGGHTWGRRRKGRTDILCLDLNIYGGEQCPRTDLCSVLKGPEVCCHLGKEDLLSFGNWPFCDVRHPLSAWMILMRSCTILARVLSWAWEQLSPWPNLTQAPLSPLLDWASTLSIALSDLPSSVLTRILLNPVFERIPTFDVSA